MEKQTQVREIVTNTNRFVTYMPRSDDRAPRTMTLILRRQDWTFSDWSRGAKKDTKRELEKLIRRNELERVRSRG